MENENGRAKGDRDALCLDIALLEPKETDRGRCCAGGGVVIGVGVDAGVAVASPDSSLLLASTTSGASFV